MTIGEKIKINRQRKGLSQAKLGEMLSLSQQAVAKWEKSFAEPDTNTLKKLADLFDVSVDYLVGHDEITPEEKAAGAAETKKISITPLEDEMLYLFREVGRKHGEQAQQALITVAEKML